MTPTWALTLVYWLHMLATVTWIGGLTALALFVLPAARRSLEGEAFAKLLAEIQRRLDPLGWFCLALLAATGLFQMSASPNYQGFLTIKNTWATAMLAKHLLFAVMTALSAYLTWFLMPQMRRVALLLARGQAPDDVQRLERKNLRLLRLNLALALLVLAFTALARAS